MITISTYWGITIIVWIIIGICLILLKKGDLEIAGIIPAGIATILFWIWFIYTMVRIMNGWNTIPQIIKFT